MSRGVLLLVLFLCSMLLPRSSHANEYSDGEALALAISGALLAPRWMVEQVDADLAAIRAFDPRFTSFHAWGRHYLGVLVVWLTSSAFDAFLAGNYHGLDKLNDEYGPVVMRVYFAPYRSISLTFDRPYNNRLLAAIYRGAPGTILVEIPGGVMPPDPVEVIAADELGTYTFRYGWGDCPSGCIYWHTWTFGVDEGIVTLVEEFGDALSVSEASWSRVKSRYRD